MDTLFDRQLVQIFEQYIAEEKGLILTPNLRLSRYLQERYTGWQPQKAITPLKVYSLSLWLEQLYQELSWQQGECFPLLMDSFQESWLWNQIIEQSELTPSLINQQATAVQAQDAWRLIQEWQLDLFQLQKDSEIDSETQKDSRIFYTWCNRFLSICNEKNLISQAQLLDFLQTKLVNLSTSSALVPSSIWRYGFDELSPKTNSFFNQLSQQGVIIKDFDPISTASQKTRTGFLNETDEIRQIARWAKKSITNNSQQTIGIIFPNLTQKRIIIETLFREEFESEYIQPKQVQHAPSFNMSAGQPLAEMPAIIVSLSILQTAKDDIPLNQLTQLLVSPFVGIQEELIWRAECDRSLRKLNEHTIGFLQFKRVISESQLTLETGQSHFYECLSSFELIRVKSKKQDLYPSDWCAIFVEFLNCWNWPGNRQIDSLEYQQLQTWQSRLEYFAGLDFLVGKITYSSAVHLFSTLLHQTTFHAETYQSSVQILGTLEAAGLPFDQLWIAEMDAQSWPESAKPNALLPIKLQRQHNLPHASAERELSFAQRMNQRWENSTNKLFVSYVTQKDDQHNQISQLLSHYSETEYPALHSNSYADIFYQAANTQITIFNDEQAPNIKYPDKIRGGTQLIKSQAACPFQAFANHRLYAEEISSPDSGLNAMERGNIIHEILDIIWRQLKNQQELLALSDEQLRNLINTAVIKALQHIRHKRVAGPQFIRIEKERLFNQIWRWMQIERKRKPFKVLSQESKTILQLGQLPIQMRYDRIDELEDGSLLVLDYKTGNNTLADWQTERPDEPQVPLYAIANKEKVSAASFGIINHQKVALVGICDNKELMPELTPAEKNKSKGLMPDCWQEILQHWENNLTQLADDFIQGKAAVAPKKSSTCEYCQLKGLCRKYEQTNNMDFDDNQEEEQELNNE